MKNSSFAYSVENKLPRFYQIINQFLLNFFSNSLEVNQCVVRIVKKLIEGKYREHFCKAK